MGVQRKTSFIYSRSIKRILYFGNSRESIMKEFIIWINKVKNVYYPSIKNYISF